MGEWHRFQLIQVLDPTEVQPPTLTDPVGGYSKAKAACVDWNRLTGEYELTGEYITVHDWQGRHYGLPGECGWARCTDAHWPEVVDLGGLFRRGKLDDALEAEGTATVSIWEDQGAGLADTGFNVEVSDFLLPAGGVLPAGTKVDIRYSELSEEWYVVSPARPPAVLGKTSKDLNNNTLDGAVVVYSVPDGSQQGDETSWQGRTIEAFNKFFGFIPEGTWIWCQNDGDGYYITACEQSDNLVGYIELRSYPAGGSDRFLYVPGGGGSKLTVSVRVAPKDLNTIAFDNTLPTISAAIRSRAMFEGERIVMVWTGGTFTVISGEFDGGVLCKNTTGQVNKGGAWADGSLLVALDAPGTSATYFLGNTGGKVVTPFGDFPGSKEGWLALNCFGGFATAAECDE